MSRTGLLLGYLFLGFVFIGISALIIYLGYKLWRKIKPL
jgi:hypothetical protein